MAYTTIDGEDYTQTEAEALLELGMIEECEYPECPHEYHREFGYSDADLIVTLERLGIEGAE